MSTVGSQFGDLPSRQPQKPPKPKPPNTISNCVYDHLSQLQSHAPKLQILAKKLGFAEHLDELSRERRVGVEWAQGIVVELHDIIAGVLTKMTDHGELFADNDCGPSYFARNTAGTSRRWAATTTPAANTLITNHRSAEPEAKTT